MIKYLDWQATEMEAKVTALGIDNSINQTAIEDKVNIIRGTAASIFLEGALKKEGINKTQEEIKQIGVEMQATLAKIAQGWKALDLEGKKLRLETWSKEMDKSFPGIGQVLGRVVNSGIEQVNTLLEGQNAKAQKVLTEIQTELTKIQTEVRIS